jgi:UDP:flavonoid glycosyltransferase YjiC (YdhE family)
MATVHLAPSIFRSVIDPPKLPGLFMPNWLPRALKRKIWDFGDRWYIDPIVCPGLNAFRAEEGLSPVRQILKNWWHSPDLTIGLWPEWFAPVQPDWPPQARLAGFPLFDERGLDPLPAHLQTFLASGDKPIAFTPGSAMWQGRAFFEASAAACQRLGRRGLLLSRHADHIPPNLPAGVIHVEYAPFSELLPHVAALVHHGGIGTTSQGLAAGVPQLIMPMSHDQPDNAQRLARLGVGAAIPRNAYRGPAVARALRRLLDSTEVRQRCRAVRERFTTDEPFTRACGMIEALPARIGQSIPV